MYHTNLGKWILSKWSILTIIVVAGLFSPALAQNAKTGGRGHGANNDAAPSHSTKTETIVRTMEVAAPATFHFDLDDGDAEGWAAFPASQWSVSDGSLNVAGNGSDQIRYALYSDDFTNATIQVDARQTNGVSSTWYPAYGIIVRSDESANSFYEFDIAADGQYSIAIFENGAWFDLVEWTQSDFIATEPTQWNTLKVECSGSTFKFHINGNLVETITDTAYSSGKVGVVAWEGDDPESPIEVQFDNISIWTETDDEVSYRYCLPYLLADSTNTTAVALENMDTAQTASVAATIYVSDGNVAGALSKTIVPDGQVVFFVEPKTVEEGWVLLNSHRKLAGLSFIGTDANPDFMMGVSLISEFSSTLHVPQVAQNDRWDTVVFVCNPNENAIDVTFAYRDQDGAELCKIQINVNGHGSVKVDLQTLLGGATADAGSLKITASRAIAGFALYSDLKTGNQNYAAIAATAP